MTQLEILQARKAKAEAMGPDVIRANRALYDQICDEIFRLQLTEDVDKELAAVMADVLQRPWPEGDYLTDCATFFPAAAGKRQLLEKQITEVCNRGHPEAFRWYLPLYRRAWIELNELANKRLDLERTMERDGCTKDYEATPWDTQSA